MVRTGERALHNVDRSQDQITKLVKHHRESLALRCGDVVSTRKRLLARLSSPLSTHPPAHQGADQEAQQGPEVLRGAGQRVAHLDWRDAAAAPRTANA